MEFFVTDEDYAIDPSLRLLKNYESVSITDRYWAAPDFQFVSSFGDGRNYTLLNSRPYSVVVDDDGRTWVFLNENIDVYGPRDKRMLKVTGRGVLALLERRSTRANYALEPDDTQENTMGRIICDQVQRYAVTGVNVGDAIPKLSVAPVYPGPWRRVTIERGDLYDIVRALAESASLGIGMGYNNLKQGLLFSVYEGMDRSDPLQPTSYAEVSESRGSAREVRRFTSSSDFFNHVKVTGVTELKDGNGDDLPPRIESVDVFGNGATSGVSGIQKRSKFLLVDDIDQAEMGSIAQYRDVLTQRGLEVLAEHKFQKLIEADVSGSVSYKPNMHYYLGDIVRVADNVGLSRHRVTEMQYTFDATGKTIRPTLQEVI